MDKGLRCEKLTIYVHAGEGEDGRARYMPVRLDGAIVFVRHGARQSPLQAARNDSRAVLYLFDRALITEAGYVPEAMFDALPVKDGYWTVHADGRDRVCVGWTSLKGIPTDRPVYRPMRVARNDRGRYGMRHLKVECA